MHCPRKLGHYFKTSGFIVMNYLLPRLLKQYLKILKPSVFMHCPGKLGQYFKTSGFSIFHYW